MSPTAIVAPRALRPLLLCFSHLRWDLVVQRPHHLFRRAVRDYDVVYFEEPVRVDGPTRLDLRNDSCGVVIATPHLNDTVTDQDATLRHMVNNLLARFSYSRLMTWYYTPMALSFSAHLKADLRIYDCMDELSAFKFAPTAIGALEDRLFSLCDVVFTGGRSLYEAKRRRHARVLCLPSSIDVKHFQQARSQQKDPADQAGIAKPRVGFFGVIDERMDLDLVRQTAGRLPEVQFVMLGPVVKVDPANLPKAANIHWLGPKSYDALPAYMANWQAGWMPFALNESTRFISPTKTPEFLAAGLPLVSTAIADVVSTYASENIVTIVDAKSAPHAILHSLEGTNTLWRAQVDKSLSRSSWDATWEIMQGCIEELVTGDVVLSNLQAVRRRSSGISDHV